jgi:hypothetical protein
VTVRQKPLEPGAKVALLRREEDRVVPGAVVSGGERMYRLKIGRVVAVR